MAPLIVVTGLATMRDAGFLTTKEAAAVLGISLRTVQAHIKAGNLEARKIGRDWHITEEEVERFKQEKRPAHRPKKP